MAVLAIKILLPAMVLNLLRNPWRLFLLRCEGWYSSPNPFPRPCAPNDEVVEKARRAERIGLEADFEAKGEERSEDERREVGREARKEKGRAAGKEVVLEVRWRRGLGVGLGRERRKRVEEKRRGMASYGGRVRREGVMRSPKRGSRRVSFRASTGGR